MIPEISVEETARRLRSGEPTYLLDVRQPWENAVAALPNTTLIPLGELPSRIEQVEPPEGALVVVYCHHGVRSKSGAFFLTQAGIANVVSMAGGIDEWSTRVDPAVPKY